MTEELLQYIWEFKLYNNTKFIASTGEEIEIISPGNRNSNAGPDFFDTRISINGTTWIGNCEVHIHSSDWFKHQHHLNVQYNNVILHVVLKNDSETYTSKGRKVPTIVLTYPAYVEKNYYQLINNQNNVIGCGKFLNRIDRIHLTTQFSRITIERLMKRYQEIKDKLNHFKNDWETAFYISLARAFGFHVNSLPFEQLATGTDLHILRRHSNSLMQIEAILFGQAGMLNQSFKDDFAKLLYKEYSFLKNKYNLQPLNSSIWKNSRIRPTNFPTIRISQFANLLYKEPNLFSKVISYSSIKEISTVFDVSASTYWNNHFLFDKRTDRSFTKKISPASIQLIIINTIVPYVFAYGVEKNNDELKDRAIQLLEELPAEINHITKQWEKLDVIARNAFESQALIEQFTYYCNRKRCINCSISQEIFKLSDQV